MEPHHHVLNYIFLPYRCDTSTCRERFQAFFNVITPNEWERLARWKEKIETNFNQMRDTTNNLGSDAAVSRAMKKWVEMMTGVSVDAAYAMKYMERMGSHGSTPIYSLDPSTQYRETHLRTPVYYPQSHYYSGHPPGHIGYDAGFIHPGNIGNIYNLPRIPQSTHIPRPMPNIRSQSHPRSRSTGVFTIGPTSVPPNVTSNADFEWESSTDPIHCRKFGPRHPWGGPAVKRLEVSERNYRNWTPQYTPIPNPSGRKTPPHQRSPKLRNSIASVSNLDNTRESPTVASKLTEGSRVEVAKTIIKEWADENDSASERQKVNLSQYQNSSGLEKVSLPIAGLKETTAQSVPPTAPSTGFLVIGKENISNSTRPIDEKAYQREAQALLKEQDAVVISEESSISRQAPDAKKRRNSQNSSHRNPKEFRGERRNYARAVSGLNKNNEDQQHSVALPTFINSNTNPAMLASQQQLSSECNTRTKRHHVTLNYAKAVSGVDRRNEESREVSRALIPSDPIPVVKSTWANVANWRNNDSRADLERTSQSVSPKSPAAPPNERSETSGVSAPVEDPLPGNPTSLSSRKSWSSIVTGRISDTSPRYQKVPVNIETLEYPELGSQLGTPSSNHLSGTRNPQSKPYLSAQAKSFEPTGSYHNFPVDRYRNTTNSPRSLPFPAHNPLTRINSSPILSDSTNAYYPDPLLETFFNTPQLVEYWSKSYDRLLFHQNLLRVQFLKIETVFQDEWDMITPDQRRAIVSRAISNLDEKPDRIQLWDTPNLEKMLIGLGLAGPTFKANRYGSRGGRARVSHLRNRADYCFDLDPDAFANSSYWLFNMIGLLLGTQIPLKYYSTAAQYQTDGSINSTDSSCADDCSQCMGAGETVIDGQNLSDESGSSNSRAEPPMLERFLDVVDCTVKSENCEPEINKGTKKSIPEKRHSNCPEKSYTGHSENRTEDRIPPHINFMSAPRLMSNRFQDSVFKSRSQEWAAHNPGRARFMKIIEIDISLFYCEFIEEILHIFGEIRRERVWYTLPTIWDFFNGPASPPPQSKNQIREGRLRAKNSRRSAYPRERSMSCPTWGCKELSQLNRYNKWVQSPGKLSDAKRAVDRERIRVHNFVRETQRTADWAIAGLKLVERETGREVERAWDGGLWSMPIPNEETQALQAGFAQLHIWRGWRVTHGRLEILFGRWCGNMILSMIDWLKVCTALYEWVRIMASISPHRILGCFSNNHLNLFSTLKYPCSTPFIYFSFPSLFPLAVPL